MDATDWPNKLVVGFAIDMELLEVALIHKKRGPDFLIGKLNGCGGHIKIGEGPVGAMRREAAEEIGLDLPESGQWQQFYYERRYGNGKELWFYVADVRDLRKWTVTQTDEHVEIISIPEILYEMSGYVQGKTHNSIERLGDKGSRYVYNLGYLIPMALCWLKNPQHAYTGG